MSTQSRVNNTAEILDISAYRRRSDSSSTRPLNVTADLLSIRQNLDFRASLEVDELMRADAGIDGSVRNRLMRDVRSLLDAEFGKLRINCEKGVFQVRHRSLESLIAGLLRCQFHARQIAWTRSDGGASAAASAAASAVTDASASGVAEMVADSGIGADTVSGTESAVCTGLGLTWGVGDSLDEAEADRVKRRSRKNKQV